MTHESHTNNRESISLTHRGKSIHNLVISNVKDPLCQLNIILTLFGYLPGIIHAVYIIAKK